MRTFIKLVKEESTLNIINVPFCTIDWSKINATQHPGIKGNAYWKTFEMGNIRVRMVEYSPEYIADHWCDRGHILLVLEGELYTELSNGEIFKLTPGMSFQVADNENPHKTYTSTGAKTFIVD